MKARSLLLVLFTVACGRPPAGRPKRPVKPVERPPGPVPARVEEKPVEAGRSITLAAEEFGRGEMSGAQVRGGAIELWRHRDEFKEDSTARYGWEPGTTEGRDEYGAYDFATDAAYYSWQTIPAPSLFLEAHDNDSLAFKFDLPGVVKGYVSFEIMPTRMWPSNGQVILTVQEDGQNRYYFALAAGEYKRATQKTIGGKVVCEAPGGRPFYTNYVKLNIYEPSQPVADDAREWRKIRFLWRPAYAAGSLDGSVCRELEDPERRPIIARRARITFQQQEGYLRDLQAKALLGTCVLQPLKAGWKGADVELSAETPEKTRAGLQLRAADNEGALSSASWWGPEEGYFLHGGEIPPEIAQKAFVQFKVLLKAEHDAAFDATPRFLKLEVRPR